MVGTSWIWLDTGSSFVPYVASTFVSNRWVSIASNLPQDGIEYSFLRCRASVHQGSCWTTLDTEESLFGSIRRPSWGVLIASFHILIWYFLDFHLRIETSYTPLLDTSELWGSSSIASGKLVLHPHRIPTFGNTCLL
jgi:hypothetical protein